MSLFTGVKIVDLSRVFSGPFATRHFSDFGAEVIKIEPPRGDESRNFPPFVNGWSGYFELLNRNKTSLTLDLKNRFDLNRLYELSKTADVFVENFSPLIKKKLKIDYTDIKKYNDKIIYASITGISDTVNRKYYDVIAQAESGFISLNGATEDMKVSTSVVDAFSGIKLAHAISSALYFREKNKLGTKITVSMKGSAFDLLEQNLIAASLTKENPHKVGNMDNAIAPFGLFKTKNGGIALAVGNESLWNTLELFLLENNDSFPTGIFTSNRLRLENLSILRRELEKVFGHYTSAELVVKLTGLGIPCGEIKTMTQVLADHENFEENLLSSYSVAGNNIVVSTGGIFYNNIQQVPYKAASAFTSKTTKQFEIDTVDQVVQLLNLCFVDKKITAESFLWKHFHPLFENKSMCRMTYDQDTATAVACFTPVKVTCAGETLTFYSCAVQATHPEYRRRGLISTLTLEIEHQLPEATNYLGFSNLDGVKIDRYSKRINYVILGQFYTSYFFPNMFKRCGKYSFAKVAKIKRSVDQSRGTNFIEIYSDENYIKWKFQDNPKKTYTFFEIYKDEHLIGHGITQVQKYKIELVKLLIQVDNVEPDLFISFANYIWRKHKKLVAFTYLRNTFWNRRLPWIKFSKKNHIYFTIKTHNQTYKEVDNWLIQGGDIQ